MKPIFYTVVMAMTLSACSLFPQPGDLTKKYTLGSLNDQVTPHRPTRANQLVVELPMIYPPLDNTRIAVKPQAQVIDYYADAEWADRLSALIQESLIYSLQNKHAFRGVSRPIEVFQADYSLKVEVRKFNITCCQKAAVDYMAHLIHLPERQIVTSRQFSKTIPIAENSMDAIVSALNQAHLEASKDLLEWVVRLGH